MNNSILQALNMSNDSNDILSKKPTKEDYIRNLNLWCQRNFYIICISAIVFLLIIFVAVCFAVVGVSATESGGYYYHLI